MKDGTRYAAVFKKTYKKLRQSVGPCAVPDSDDPVRRLAIATLGVESTDAAGERAVTKLLAAMTDWNEVRVSYPDEVQAVVGSGIANSMVRCGELIRALNAVYQQEHAVSLERLRSLGRREAKQYFESIDAISEYASASVILWSLGGHAVPVNDRLLDSLRNRRLVHPGATRGEVQAFLERHVAAVDAKETCIVLQSLTISAKKTATRATAKKTAKKRTKTERSTKKSVSK